MRFHSKAGERSSERHETGTHLQVRCFAPRCKATYTILNFFLPVSNVPGAGGSIEVGNYTASIISLEDGQYLVGEVVAGRPVAVTFPQVGGIETIQSPTGGLMSSFSTFGPTNDLYFKPSIAAPGGNILSTLPVPLGSYAIESGTSMGEGL